MTILIEFLSGKARIFFKTKIQIQKHKKNLKSLWSSATNLGLFFRTEEFIT